MTPAERRARNIAVRTGRMEWEDDTPRFTDFDDDITVSSAVTKVWSDRKLASDEALDALRAKLADRLQSTR